MFGGPTKGELAQQVATLTAKRDQLETALDQSRQYVLDLDAQLAKARREGPIVDAIHDELMRREESGEITFAAEEVARNAVLEALTRERTEGISAKILSERRRQLEAKYGPEWTSQQRDNLINMFEHDGTFTKLDEEVRTEAHHRTANEVREQERLRILEKYTSPEVAAKGKEVALQALIASGEAEKIEAAIREMHQADWREAAIAEVKHLYAEKLDQERATFMAAYGQEWLDSYPGREFQTQARREAERRWESLTVEQKQESVRHLIDEELLAEQARLESGRITRENAQEAARQRHQELYDDFDKLGIDMTAVPVGSTVTLQCGEQMRSIHPNYAGYSYHKEYERDLLVLDRQVVLTSRGDGTYIVVSDTLCESDNKAEQELSMPKQHVVTIGYKVTETANGDTTTTLLTRIRRGVEFAFDDDPSTPQDIQPGLYQVANVIIDGVSYLQVEPENMVARDKVPQR